MPGTMAEGPSVPMSFANNFWGKEDAGVQPLLARMHCAKVTSEELKSFYRARAEIEDEYARKLLSLCRRPLGKDESGTLKDSLDVLRGEVESIARAHKSVADQMKTELEEPMGAFAGMMRERRKIVQGGIEKLLKTKTQQTNTLNKTRDKYEQDCLRIKGYLAQGHMVMGQEERKNKAKLEKTQLQMSASENDYKVAVSALEETTGRWNRDWKAACDKFQDLEEERLDFTKSSLWTFANIASTVCVTDDASCEKVRLSLEKCEVEKDIESFINGQGTGQEIPEPPKFINYCRDDIDSASEVSDDDYSVAQFPRTMNPAYRTSSPQPSTFESHHDPDSELAQQMGLGSNLEHSRESREDTPRASQQANQRAKAQAQSQAQRMLEPNGSDIAPPPMYNSDRSTNGSPSLRPDSSDLSECSAPTSVSSAEPMASPSKSAPALASEQKAVQKKRSGFFSNSPFRRRSKHEKSRPNSVVEISNQVSNLSMGSSSAKTTPSKPGIQARDFAPPASDLEPVDPRASFQLNVGNNVFDVASPDSRRKSGISPATARFDAEDPVAAALQELRGLTGRDKSSAARTSADRYHGLATPQPGQQGAEDPNKAQRSTPLPGYSDQGSNAMQRLGAPAPAHTAASMTATTRKYTSQNASMYGAAGATASGNSRPGSGGNGHQTNMPRSTSPVPIRSTSPRPGLAHAQAREQEQRDERHHQRQGSGLSAHGEPVRRSGSPNPYGNGAWAARGAESSGYSPGHGAYNGHNSNIYSGSPGGYRSRQNSPGDHPMAGANMSMRRDGSPQPPFARNDGGRPGSGMAMTLSNGPSPQIMHGGLGGSMGRPASYYGGGGPNGYAPQMAPDQRHRSKSLATGQQFSRDGRPILHFARAMFSYTAAIPEELSFAKSDVLAVTRLQDDGWWEAEVSGRPGGRLGLVPSNYLQKC